MDFSKLIKSVTFEIGGQPVQKHKSCKKCNKLFECAINGDEELDKLRRRLANKPGNMTLCWTCDIVEEHK